MNLNLQKIHFIGKNLATVLLFILISTPMIARINGQNKPLIEILELISQEYQVIFTYDVSTLAEVDVPEETTFHKDEKLETVVNRVLATTQLRYRHIGEKYYIIYKNNKEGSRKAKRLGKQIKKIQKIEQSNNIILQSRKYPSWNKSALSRIIQNSQLIKPDVIITGKVSDELGDALVGATIHVKGTSIGVVSDIDGNYQLNVPEEATTLVVSYLGYLTQNIEIEGRTVIDIIMKSDFEQLDEVVIVGYGTQRKQDVTGAVGIADLETYEAVPVNNVFETVKGTVSGLNVGATNSAGQVGSLSIRGQNTPTASNAPLIVVDGVIFSGSLADLQSNDIESLSVLKDASAAAVYGARSANGVILIQTKAGEGINGKPKFLVNVSSGISNQLRPLELFDGPSYIQRVLDVREANGLTHDPNEIASYLTAVESENYLATSDHKPTFNNPYDLMNRTGYTSKLNFGVSQSNKNTSYYISTTLTDQEGVRVGDKFNNFNGRVNIKTKLADWFTLGIKSYYSRRDNSGAVLSSEFQFMSPYASIFNEDGSYRFYPQDHTSFRNPYLFTPNVAKNVGNTLNGIFTGIFRLPTKGLTYTINYSNTFNWNNTASFFDENTIQGLSKNGIGSRSTSNSHSYLIDQIVNYKRIFDDKHKVDLTLLYSREQRKSESLIGEAEDFSNTRLLDFGLETALIQRAFAGGEKQTSVGKMARLSYTFDNKYALTGTIREDGFSAFSEGKKKATFYSLGVNWNVANERFLQNSKTINNLAIRASYGKNGNPSVEPYATLAQIGNSKYLLGEEVVISQGLRRLALSVFGWETTTAFNLGVDFDILDHRIHGSLNAYKSKTNDLLFNRPLPAPAGTSALRDNVGEIQNKGIELDLNTVNIQNENFRWESNFVFSLNRNKVVSITGDDNDGDGVEDDLISNGYFIGKPLGTIYGYKVIGTWQEGDDIIDGLRPGDYKVEDVDGDGRITSDKDRQFLGNASPNFRWSFTNTFTYKNWSVMAYLYSIWGGNGNYLSMSNTPYYDWQAAIEAGNGIAWNYWTPTNTNTPWPRVNYKDGPYYQATKPFDRSFIKLQKVAISYNLSDLVKQYGIEGLNLSLSGDNLATYAPHWIGLDPESNQGLRTGSVPSMRTYTLSLRLNF